MKYALILLTAGVVRGLLFPDYRWGPNIIIIPFGMPLLAALGSAYWGVAKRFGWLTLALIGLVAVYLSDAVGIVVYGSTVGWQYVTDDTESQAVFIATASIQTIVYILGYGLFAFLSKRYNNAVKRDAPQAARPLL